MIVLAANLGLARHRRLELLVGFFLLPFLLGAFIGELFPYPSLIRLHLLRSESFLLMFSMVLVQIYGARILSRLRYSPQLQFGSSDFRLSSGLSMALLCQLCF